MIPPTILEILKTELVNKTFTVHIYPNRCRKECFSYPVTHYSDVAKIEMQCIDIINDVEYSGTTYYMKMEHPETKDIYELQMYAG